MRRTTLSPRNPDKRLKPKVVEWFSNHHDSELIFEQVLRFMQARYLGSFHGYIDRNGYPEYRFDGLNDDHGTARLFARNTSALVRFWVDPKRLTERWKKEARKIRNRCGNLHSIVDIRYTGSGDIAQIEQFLNQNRINTFAGKSKRSKATNQRKAIELQLKKVSDDLPDGLDGGYKLMMVKARLNHGKLRKGLLNYYGGKCWVSGIVNPRLLVCSHIVPYSKAKNHEQNDPDNILLLASNWDALFDRYLISFDAKGRLMKSRNLAKKDLVAMGVGPSQGLDMSRLERRRPIYLARHRAEFQRRERALASR